MRSSIDNTLHGREMHEGILLQIKKSPEAGGVDLTCYVFSLEDATARLNVTDPGGILTIEKRDIWWRCVNFIAPKRAIKFCCCITL